MCIFITGGLKGETLGVEIRATETSLGFGRVRRRGRASENGSSESDTEVEVQETRWPTNGGEESEKDGG